MGSALGTDEQTQDSPSYMENVTVVNPGIRLASNKSKNVHVKQLLEAISAILYVFYCYCPENLQDTQQYTVIR